MKCYRLVIKVTFSAILIAASFTVFGQKLDSAPRSVNALYALTPSQVSTYKDKANEGDADAATRLALYYDFIQSDYEAAYFWLKKAADSGDAKAQFNLGVRTLGKGGVNSCEEAKHRFSLSKKNGFDKAQKELDRIETCPNKK